MNVRGSAREAWWLIELDARNKNKTKKQQQKTNKQTKTTKQINNKLVTTNNIEYAQQHLSLTRFSFHDNKSTFCDE